MPLDGHDSTLPPRRPPDRSTRMNKQKRIMMNPPTDFVQAALVASPIVPVNNAIVFDQGGQAVMVTPGALEESAGVEGEDAESSLAGQESQVAESHIAPLATASAAVTAAGTPAQTQSQGQTPTQAQSPPVETPTEASIIEMVTTQVTTATVTPTSAVTATEPTPTDSQQSPPTSTALNSGPTSINPSTTTAMPSMRISSSAPSSTSSSISSSASASATPSAAETSAESKPFTRTAPFIFLMVLGSLVIVAVAATLFSTFFRWKNSCGCLPCCRPDPEDDEDGLSDLVRSFDLERTSTAGLSRASSMRRPVPMMDARQVSLQRRSSLFANSPSQAGFLHTTSGVEGSIFESEDEKSSTEHLYGGSQRPLEIKNAVEGDIPGENDSHAGIGPRHLGVEGNGLEVPWRPAMPLRAYTGSEASYGEHHSQVGYPDAPFPSPPVTINEQPTRASTWASNLRSTLFAAISTNQGQGQQGQEDRYTRQVLPLHRNSTVKSTRSMTDNDNSFSHRHYPLVIDEKDEQELDASTEEVGKRFMMRDESRTSASSRGTMRMSMGDRFQSWSRGGGGGGDGWPKPVLAGGGRARGATGQYV